MYSAGSFWDEDKSEWRKGKKFKKFFGRKFLDSGGYLMLLKYGYYPFSVDSYANLIARLEPNFYASMDYACEPDLIDQNKTRYPTVESRIRETVKNAKALSFWEDILPGKMLPVIQGYTLDEYLECIELYKQSEMIRDYMAVGSMCRRIDQGELNKLIPGIHKAFIDAGGKHLHFFGLKLSPDLCPLDKFIYSRDSAVSLDSYDPLLRKKRGGRRYPKGQLEKKEAFRSFLGRLDSLGLKYTNGSGDLG